MLGFWVQQWQTLREHAQEGKIVQGEAGVLVVNEPDSQRETNQNTTLFVGRLPASCGMIFCYVHVARQIRCCKSNNICTFFLKSSSCI